MFVDHLMAIDCLSLDRLAITRWFFVLWSPNGYWLFIPWSLGDHEVILCSLITCRPFYNWDSCDRLVVTKRLCYNCSFVQHFPIGTKYCLFNYCFSYSHFGAPNICYWNYHFVEINNVLIFIISASFLFLGTNLCVTCGEGVEFLYR